MRAPYPIASLPSTAADSERPEKASLGAKRPLAPAAPSAPSTMPMSMTDVTSSKTPFARAVLWKPPLQKAAAAGSHPSNSAALAPHSVKDHVIDHGWPATTRVTTLRTESSNAPITSMRCRAALREASTDLFRRERAIRPSIAHASARTASCTAIAAGHPSLVPSEISPHSGRRPHHGMCRLARNEPPQKAASTATILGLPPPAV